MPVLNFSQDSCDPIACARKAMPWDKGMVRSKRKLTSGHFFLSGSQKYHGYTLACNLPIHHRLLYDYLYSLYIRIYIYVCMYTQNTSVSFYIHIYKHRYVQYSYKHMDLPLYSYNATATLSYFQPRRVHNVNQAHMSLPKVTRINGTEATQCSSTIPAHHAEKRKTQPG